MFGTKKEKADKELFSIYDSKVAHWGDPIIAINRFDMMRSYEVLLRQHPMDQKVTNAEDFAIFKIGDYSSSTGRISSHAPEHVANLHELRVAFDHKNQPKSGPVGITST